jgi:hypothetical protein
MSWRDALRHLYLAVPTTRPPNAPRGRSVIAREHD